ncbi:MAG: hypothetical protein WC460_04335 [Patescibacteria group bacterium]
MKRNKMTIITIVIVILFLVIIWGVFYTPKYKGAELKFNQLCVLAEKGDQVSILCNKDNNWFEKFIKQGEVWQLVNDKEINISEYKYLTGQEIKNKNLDNLFVGEGGYVFHEPLKKMIKDNNRYRFSVGIGLEGFSEDLSASYIVLRIYKDFKEYTYGYELKNDKVGSIISFYYSIIY